uniref:Uncharacterized protein n=1 Tax=Mycena chlorophos TaxID=658473 RepID=A0ABQ0L6W1_MYCCL|nr:predicted protein [Mycena chlorophos]
MAEEVAVASAPSPSPPLSPQSRVYLQNVLEELGFLIGPDSNISRVAGFAKRKAAPPRNATNRNAFQQIVNAAKFTPRGADAYWDLGRTMEYGCMHAVDANGPEVIAAIPPIEGAPHHVAVFAKIFATCRYDVLPVLHYLWATSRVNPAPWRSLVDRLKAAARQARTQDTNTFKSALRIFLPVPGRDVFDPPVDIGASKARRGLAHPQLCLLLMPWRDRSHYPPLTFERSSGGLPELSDDAKRIDAEIALHKYNPSSKRFPSFCYAAGEYDPASYRRNLFRNIVVVRVLRLLWLTRADANDVPRNTIPSGSLAAIHGITRITPHMVAYVIVQMRLALSSLPEWRTKESKNYSFITLYYKVIDAFADEDDEDLPKWANKTLDWLTELTFGNVDDDPRAVPDEADEDQSEDEAAAQRKRRRVVPDPVVSDPAS